MGELAGAVEIVKDKLYIAAVRSVDNLQALSASSSALCFSIDNELLYEPFFADFGPLNMGLTYRFCAKLDNLLMQYDQASPDRRQAVYFCCAADPYRKANAATLMGIYCTLYFGWPADEAYKPLTALKPFAPFRDASCGASTFHLTVLDCIRAMEKAKSVGFVDFHLRDKSTFNLEEYEYYEQVENGDSNWIVPNKFIAFSGPSAKRTEFYGYRTLVPEDYWEVFSRWGVSAVIRLNKKVYEKRRFSDGGFRHHDMYFPDGSCPTEAILKRFLEVTEQEPGVCCVHCKAGLGRTGVLISCYMMKHYKFTANEAIGYIRICRPGSVIGPQQHYLKEMEQKCWRMGDQYRAHMQNGGMAGSDGAGIEYENDDGSGDRRTSPMKPLRSGTRPSALSTGGMVNNLSSRLGAGLNISSSTPTSQSSGIRGAVTTSSYTSTSGSRAQIRGTKPLGSTVVSSLSDLRRAPAQPTGSTRRIMSTTMHTDTVDNAHNRQIIGAGLDANNIQGAQQAYSRSLSSGRAATQPGQGTSSGSHGLISGIGNSPLQMAPGSAPPPGHSPVRQSGSPIVQRIVTASGQPRKLLGGPTSPSAMGFSSPYSQRTPSASSPYGRPSFPLRRST